MAALGKYAPITESDDYADERLLELLVVFSRMSRRLYSPIAVAGELLRTASQMDTRIATWRISNHRQDGLRISEPMSERNAETTSSVQLGSQCHCRRLSDGHTISSAGRIDVCPSAAIGSCGCQLAFVGRIA